MKKFLTVIGLISLLLCGCAQEAPAPEASAAPAPAATPAPVDGSIGKLRISELMPKNHSTLRDEDGDFSDWIELENCSGESLNLDGWRLSDDSSQGWALPARSLAAGERLLVFASGKDRAENELHTDFKLSAGETLTLRTPMGNISHSADCGNTGAD